MSKFLSFAFPISTVDEAKDIIARFKKEYYDARHVCWAYMLGVERTNFLSTDNGEPSGTAGKPILGQINSTGITDVIILVVRYFGGIKLGTSGLIVAYREAARMAIDAGVIVERHAMGTVSFTFPYIVMNDVMKLTKDPDVCIISQTFDNTCAMTLSTRLDNLDTLRSRLCDIDGLTLN